MSKKLAVDTVQQIAPEGNMLYQKVIARWKDMTEWINLRIQIFDKKLKMKMKNEDEKNQLFFHYTKSVEIYRGRSNFEKEDL